MSDGVPNSSDLCPTTPSGESVDVNGCATFTLAVNINVGGTGTGSVGGATNYTEDVTAMPTATPTGGSTFVWSGDCSGTTSPASVLMDGDKTCTVTFTALS